MAPKKTPPPAPPEVQYPYNDGDNIVLWEGTPNRRGEVLRATVNEYKGKKYAGVQKWYPSSGPVEQLLPGKGLKVPFDDEGVSEIGSAIDAIRKYLEQVE